MVSEFQSCKWWGYWDSRYTPKDTPVNLFRGYLNHDCKEGIEMGNRLAILLSDFKPDDSESLIRQRLQNWNKHMSVEISEATEYIILEGEPRHKEFSVGQLENMVENAKEEIVDFNFTFSFMRRACWENILPENLDVVWINCYLFYRQNYYPEMYNGTQEEFNDVLLSTVTKVRKKFPNARIILTRQTFYDDHYRKPPIESVQWYHEFIQKYDYMIGVFGINEQI